MTGGPNVMLGTKCPSITSRRIQSPPASSTARISSPSWAKSADRIDGAMIIGIGHAPISFSTACCGRAVIDGGRPAESLCASERHKRQTADVSN